MEEKLTDRTALMRIESALNRLAESDRIENPKELAEDLSEIYAYLRIRLQEHGPRNVHNLTFSDVENVTITIHDGKVTKEIDESLDT
ncbi:hypothetical protein ACFL9U_17310 [Thermodesulfobacteriota bacterium]